TVLIHLPKTFGLTCADISRTRHHNLPSFHSSIPISKRLLFNASSLFSPTLNPSNSLPLKLDRVWPRHRLTRCHACFLNVSTCNGQPTSVCFKGRSVPNKLKVH